MANKTWAEIRLETVNLGFEKIKAYEKNKAAYIEAYNYAQALIASTVDGLIDYVTISKNNNKTVMFDLQDMVTSDGIRYVGLADVGIIDSNGEPVTGYTYTANRFLTLPDDYNGTFRVYYRYLPQRINELSPDDTEVEITEKWAVLMPYLMANRLFIDDNPATAGYYYNQYDDMKNQILAGEYKNTVRVNGGINIDNTEWWW